jgi:hypothetical protein
MLLNVTVKVTAKVETERGWITVFDAPSKHCISTATADHDLLKTISEFFFPSR